MGNACSCLTGLDQHDHHAVRYGDVPKYAAPCERLQQVVPVSMSALEQKNSGSPRKGREAHPSVAVDHPDTQQLDEQGAQQWHGSPTAAERQQQHQQYQAGAGAGAGDDAAAQQQEEELELPVVPFSWTKGDLIGIGAFGRVYTALNNETGELVAVKQVSFAKDEALQGRVAEHIRALEAEVDVLRTLKHENIVRYLGTERTGDALHIFLEYVPGGSIASLLTRFGAFSESVIRNYTAQLLRGLEYLHARGIMHRDIKGANILVDKHGTVKLADFGASKKIEDLATVGSGATSIRGTPYWMAPEVIKQTGHGRPADIWSLACTVIEMATGKPPWSNLYSQPVSAMFHIASSKDPPKLPDHLSPEAKDFLMLCFNRVARDRANATRLLKHPFVTRGQLPSPQPFPGSSPGNAANSNGSPAGQRNGTHQARHNGSTPQQPSRGQAGDSRQAHTPPGARHSTGMQPAFANGGSGLRPSAGAALAAGSQARCSPPANTQHGSPRRQQQPLLQQQAFADAANSSPAGSNGGVLSQRGDASAVVTATRQQQQQPGKQQQQEEGPLQKQQQQLQQQGRQSPRHFDQQQPQQQRPSQQQLQQQAQGQQQGRRSITPRSAAEAAAAAAAGGGGGCHDTHCMTLLDWNPMVEPSWVPGAYQVPGAAGTAAGRRDKAAGGGELQYAPGRGSGNGSRPAPQPSPAAADSTEAHTPGRPQGGQGAPGSSSMAGFKRGSGASATPGSSILSAAPGSSTRSNGGIGSRKMEGNGPLASGPVGRASRENGFGLGPGAAAAAAAATAGSNAGRLGSNRAWGTGVTAAAAAAAGSASGGSPSRSLSAASCSGCDADGCEEGAGVLRANSSSTGAGSGPLLQQAEGQRLSSSGSYGRGSSQPGVAESALAQLSSKHAQWEQELFEELARQREEHRASRAAGASKRAPLQQQ